MQSSASHVWLVSSCVVLCVDPGPQSVGPSFSGSLPSQSARYKRAHPRERPFSVAGEQSRNRWPVNQPTRRHIINCRIWLTGAPIFQRMLRHLFSVFFAHLATLTCELGFENKGHQLSICSLVRHFACKKKEGRSSRVCGSSIHNHRC